MEARFDNHIEVHWRRPSHTKSVTDYKRVPCKGCTHEARKAPQSRGSKLGKILLPSLSSGGEQSNAHTILEITLTISEYNPGPLIIATYKETGSAQQSVARDIFYSHWKIISNSIDSISEQTYNPNPACGKSFSSPFSLRNRSGLNSSGFGYNSGSWWI